MPLRGGLRVRNVVGVVRVLFVGIRVVVIGGLTLVVDRRVRAAGTVEVHAAVGDVALLRVRRQERTRRREASAGPTQRPAPARARPMANRPMARSHSCRCHRPGRCPCRTRSRPRRRFLARPPRIRRDLRTGRSQPSWSGRGSGNRWALCLQLLATMSGHGPARPPSHIQQKFTRLSINMEEVLP